MDCILIKKNPQEFIERVKEDINTQFRNEDRAVFEKDLMDYGKGLRDILSMISSGGN